MNDPISELWKEACEAMTSKPKTTIDLPVRRDIPLADQCSHGKAWSEDCRQCEVVSLTESLGWMEKAVQRDRARLERLRRELADGYT